ncbi:MAG: transcriptional regulator [Pseudomonadota bacterium]
MKPSAHVRVDFTDVISIGPGKIGLLEQIERTGSLSAAARELKMSYRRAWLLLTNVNTGFSEPVAVLSVGGVEGGGARLTKFGKQLVSDYRKLGQQVDELAQKTFAGVRTSRDKAAEPAVPRRAISRSLRAKA